MLQLHNSADERTQSSSEVVGDDDSPVLWKRPSKLADDDEEESSSPVLFKKEVGNDKPPQRDKEDLYKLYEQLTGPFQELTFKDFVSQAQSSLAPPTYSVAVSHRHALTSPASPVIQTPPRRSLQDEFGRSPPSPWNQKSQRPKDGNRVSPSPSHDAGSRPSPSRLRQAPMVVEHGTCCYICHAKAMVFKTRCLVCGKLYCRACVKEAMGSMLEGRKCRTCLGERFSQRYISRAGKGWWLSSRVREVELRWAKKRPKTTLHMSTRSLEYSRQAPSF